MGHVKNGCTKPKCMSDGEITENIAFYFFITEIGLTIFNIVLMSKIRCLSKSNFHNSESCV